MARRREPQSATIYRRGARVAASSSGWPSASRSMSAMASTTAASRRGRRS